MRACLVAFVLALAGIASAVEPVALGDLNPISGQRASVESPYGFVSFGDKVAFWGKVPQVGTELCITDGTPEGTRLVRDLVPGLPDHGGPIDREAKVVVDGILYFLGPRFGANGQGVNGTQEIVLWRSDGTTEGTFPPGEFYPWTDAALLAASDHHVWYRQRRSGAEEALFISDGTEVGTRLLLDFSQGPLQSSKGYFRWIRTLGDRALVCAYTYTYAGEDVWAVDPTGSANLLVDLEWGGQPLSPKDGPVWNDRFLWIARSATWGDEIWSSDGTPGGTSLLFPRIEGVVSTWSGFRGTQAFGDEFYVYKADQSTWVSDGTTTGTRRLADISPSLVSATPVARFPEGRVFLAYSPARVIVSDLTTGGTVTVATDVLSPTLGPGLGGYLYALKKVGGGASGNDYEIWRTKGSVATTEHLFDIEGNPRDDFDSIYSSAGAPLGADRFVFQGHWGADANAPGRVSVTDGTPEGTTQLSTELTLTNDFLPYLSGPGIVGPVPGGYIFTGHPDLGGGAGSGQPRLIASNGTPESTRILDQDPAVSSSAFILTNAIAWRGGLAFPASANVGGGRLAFADPEEDTVRFLDPPISPRNNVFAAFGDELLYGSGSAPLGLPCIYDGTTTGSHPLMESWPTGSPATKLIAVLGNRAVFHARGRNAEGADVGAELFVTNGTVAGTRNLLDLAPDAQDSNFDSVAFAHDRAYYIAHSPQSTSVRHLIESDGTPAGTRILQTLDQLQDITVLGLRNGLLIRAYRDSVLSYILWFLPFDPADGPLRQLTFSASPGKPVLNGDSTLAFFVHSDPDHGSELWRTDGTQGGTKLVLDIIPGIRSPIISQLTVAGELVYFTATTFDEGTELWQTDGTAEGTMLATEGASGHLSSDPQILGVSETDLFYVAMDPLRLAGREPYALPIIRRRSDADGWMLR